MQRCIPLMKAQNHFGQKNDAVVQSVFAKFDFGAAFKKVLFDGFNNADDFIKYGNAFPPLDYTSRADETDKENKPDD